MLLRTLVAALLFVPFLQPASVRAGDEAPPTYTAAELEALDRALDAANLTREDLRFDKDLAQGHACLERVRALLRDPLEIAPTIDGLARRLRPGATGSLSPGVALLEARELLDLPAVERDRAAPPPPPTSPEAALTRLTELLSDDLEPLFATVGDDDTARHAVRRYLPEQMAWHEVFTSPFDGKTDAALKAWREGKPESWLHDQMAGLDLDRVLLAADAVLLDALEEVLTWPAAAYPLDAPVVIDTPHGRIGLGTPDDDTWTGDFAAIVEPGGNDHYVGGRVGAAHGMPGQRIGLLIDRGGDDVYDAPGVNLTLGSAVLGIALLADLGHGNDRYSAGHASLGAAMGGVGILFDDGGSDVYEGKSYTQGAAGFGLGALLDAGEGPLPAVTRDEGTPDTATIGQFDNDRFTAWSSAQAFARCRGIALLVNARGNDRYEAGGVYLHAPLFADRYQSFSQGFAIGERGVDYAGGVALIADFDGNDRYLGDIYNQGVGYWYSAGLLYDGGGNDLYEMTQYGQGSGIHLAVGGLVDEGGNDTYVMHSGLGQGGSHDYAGSVLHDRGGNDRYMGSTSCNGCGLTNSVGLHLDRGGDDIYGARRKGGINTGRPARGFGSIGVLVDLDGQDDYLGIMADDTGWMQTDVGVGLDITPPAPADGAPAATTTPDEGEQAPIPAICSYEGELTEAVFDELWKIAIRWEVGDNRRIVPEARRRLAAFGPAVLPHVDRVLGQSASGLEIRGFVGVLRPLVDEGHEEAVAGVLRTNVASEDSTRSTSALLTLADLKLTSLAPDVAKLLKSGDRRRARRAAGVLKTLGSEAGRDILLGWLTPDGDERDVAAALDALLGTGADAYDAARPLLAHPHLSVRGRLVALLAARPDDYLARVQADWRDTALPRRVRRTLYQVLVRTEKARPSEQDLWRIDDDLRSEDPGLRADAVRLLREWGEREDLEPTEAIQLRLGDLARILQSETDPFVRAELRSDRGGQGAKEYGRR